MKKPTPDTPVVFPATIIVDTREQSPYQFTGFVADATDGAGPLVIQTRTAGLASGDYSLAGMEEVVAVERKSLADLFSTIGQGRSRFERELQRLNQMRFAAVVVEAEWSTVLNDPPPHTRLTPKTIWRSVVCWQQRYTRVHWSFLPSRRHAEVMTLRVLERAWKETQKVTYDGVDAGKPVVAASVRACAALELLRIYSQARVASEASERRVLNQQVIDIGVALARAELQRMPAAAGADGADLECALECSPECAGDAQFDEIAGTCSNGC